MATPKDQSLRGKLTYIGILVSAIGATAQMFGVDVPVTEAQSMVDLIATHWEAGVAFVGLAIAAWGRIRMNWRKE